MENQSPSFCQSVLASLFGPEPAFVRFMIHLVEFAKAADQAQRDLSLVGFGTEFHSRIL